MTMKHESLDAFGNEISSYCSECERRERKIREALDIIRIALPLYNEDQVTDETMLFISIKQIKKINQIIDDLEAK